MVDFTQLLNRSPEEREAAIKSVTDRHEESMRQQIEARTIQINEILASQSEVGGKKLLQWEQAFLQTMKNKAEKDQYGVIGGELTALSFAQLSKLKSLHKIYIRPSVTGGNEKPQQAVQEAMRLHYRDQLSDSIVSYSPAWKDAKIAIRFLNHVSPLLLGVIQQPGSSADISDRKDALTFLTTATDALAKVMSQALAPSQEIKEYERLELNGLLSHVVGNLWEKSARQDPQKKIDSLVKTVAGMYQDKAFLEQHSATAQRMMDAGGYRKVDSQETMASRLRLSMQTAVMKLYSGVVDERVSNHNGDPFTYGLARIDVVKKMSASFDEMFTDLISRNQFSPSLSNDQRTSVMQSWLRNAADIYQAEYVAKTIRGIEYFRSGERADQPGQPGASDQFTTRFVQVKASLDKVLVLVAAFTAETMTDLLEVANIQAEHPKADHSEVLSSAPR